MLKYISALLLLSVCVAAQSLSVNDDDGVLPRHINVKFVAVTMGNDLVEYAVIKVGAVPVEIYMLGGNVIVTAFGQIVLAGDLSVLNQLPGGKQSATAGIHGCWLVPQPGGGLLLEQVDMMGHGDTIGEAVAEVKAQVDAAHAALWEQMPSSMCD